MKKIVTNKTFLCAALATMLVLGSCTPGTVYAAQGDIPAKKNTAENTKETVAETSTETAQAEEATPALTDEELTAYYGDSVFIGDSIMVGFRNYSAKQKNFVHGIQFLAVGSYSAFNAVKPVAGDNVHPMYKGKKYHVWDAIPLTDSKRAFILLGMNDISILGLEGARDQYKELIDKILETSPDLEIHIISVTCTLKDAGKGKLNNGNIAKYNVLLQEMAQENGWGYLDLCTPVSDGEGNLAGENCSDGFVHLSNRAYTLWESELIDYAAVQAAQTEPENGTGTAVTGEDQTGQNTDIQTQTAETTSENQTVSELQKEVKPKIGTISGSSVSQPAKGRKQS